MTRAVRKRAPELDARGAITAEQAEVIEAELVEELTTDQAEALTTRITACLTNWHAFADTITELALQAYYGQAFKALGYANWEAYARARLSLELPRSTQAAINAALINQGAISARSAAAISGTSDKTAAEDARKATAESSAVDAQGQPVPAGTPLQIVRRERREALPAEQPSRSTGSSTSGTPDPKPVKRRGADGRNRAASKPKAEPTPNRGGPLTTDPDSYGAHERDGCSPVNEVSEALQAFRFGAEILSTTVQLRDPAKRDQVRRELQRLNKKIDRRLHELNQQYPIITRATSEPAAIEPPRVT